MSSRQRLHIGVLATRLDHADGTSSMGAISHRSAADVHGLLDRPPVATSLWVPTANRVRAADYRIHRGRAVDQARDLTVIDGLRVVNRAATVCQLATAGAHDLDRVVDNFTRVSSMAWLRSTVERWQQYDPRSMGRLKQLLATLDEPFTLTDSWFERVVLGLMSHPDMPPVETQFEVTIDGY